MQATHESRRWDSDELKDCFFANFVLRQLLVGRRIKRVHIVSELLVCPEATFEPPRQVPAPESCDVVMAGAQAIEHA